MKIKRWLYKKTRWLKLKLGWRYCGLCKKFAYFKWVKDPVLFEDEPPMFYHYECTSCGACTPMNASILSENAVKKLGYKNFDDFSEKNLKKEKQNV